MTYVHVGPDGGVGGNTLFGGWKNLSSTLSHIFFYPHGGHDASIGDINDFFSRSDHGFFIV